jgi:hypothetical protein
VRPCQVISIHLEVAADLTLAHFGDVIVVLVIILLNLIIFHKKLANFIFKDAVLFVITLVDNSLVQMLLCTLEILFVFGVYGS